MNALHIATETILVAYAQEVLGLGAVGFGLLPTAGALGGLLEPGLGRDVALRIPFPVAASGIGALALFAVFYLRLGRD